MKGTCPVYRKGAHTSLRSPTIKGPLGGGHLAKALRRRGQIAAQRATGWARVANGCPVAIADIHYVLPGEAGRAAALAGLARPQPGAVVQNPWAAGWQPRAAGQRLATWQQTWEVGRAL